MRGMVRMLRPAMPLRGRILIVDDEANARAALSEILHEDGFVTETAADGFKALGKLSDFDPDVVLTDLKMPGLDGIGLMEKGREIVPGAVFLVMTAFGTIGSAVDAVKRGADNYLTKPLDFDTLVAVVERALEKSRLIKENLRLRQRLRERNVMSHIIGDSPKMKKLLQLVEQVAKSRASVLIVGESGTGKELIAEAIHRASPRAKAPLVRLNCAALAEGLLESELFGHEKGAFTGALGRREGRFKQADQGTLFLDEVSEIPAATQVKLLRFLQERAFERVGGNETLHVDVRILAATNRDLKRRLEEGRFREDLFYRLNVVSLEIPALRARVEDVAPLAAFFLSRYAEENGKRIDGFDEEALGLLEAYAWPGNVRELENAIERAVVLCDEPLVSRRHLPANIAPRTDSDGPPDIPGSSLDDIERFAILRTLEMCGGSTSKAAAVLGISSRKIQYKLHEYAPRDRESVSGGVDGASGVGDGGR
jgi:DNA-binding NtrC family response regulator